MRDLPAGVIRMNDECLKLRDHTAGYQTVEDIQAVVGEAIGLHKKPMADDDYIDEAMVPAQPCNPNITDGCTIAHAVVGGSPTEPLTCTVTRKLHWLQVTRKVDSLFRPLCFVLDLHQSHGDGPCSGVNIEA